MLVKGATGRQGHVNLSVNTMAAWWWAGDARSQVIISRGVDLLSPEYSSLDARRLKCLCWLSLGILAYRWLGHWRVWKQNEIRVKTVIYIEQIYTHLGVCLGLCPYRWLIRLEWVSLERVRTRIVGLDNGLAPNRRQVIIWTNDQWDMEV